MEQGVVLRGEFVSGEAPVSFTRCVWCSLTSHRLHLAHHRADGHARRHRYGFRQGDCAQPHCAYLFANRRTNRMKVLVHDGFGIWLAARRLNQGKFHWPGIRHGSEMELDTEQLQALVLGLPWQRAVDAAC
ncbi:IS66 family insertion sequence element accessory protein TnpB [Pseudomonas fluorescens]|uniref:IS66 family insertion sequence element accessory protein TnpB n=1 Tax=Pseudomonas TaxID=286 RepID=UPI003D0067AD